MEQWKPVRNHEGFDVSSLGRVRSYWKRNGRCGLVLSDSPRVLDLKYGGPGYIRANMRGRVILIHILVLEAFVGPRPVIPGFRVETRHLNDIRHDNRLENLCWGTTEENIADAKKNGLWKYGEQRKGSQLSDADAIRVRALYDTGEYYHRELAEMFGVGKSVIQATCSGDARRHLPLGKKTKRKALKNHKDEIQKKLDSGRTRKEVAAEYGVSLVSIYRICPV